MKIFLLSDNCFLQIDLPQTIPKETSLIILTNQKIAENQTNFLEIKRKEIEKNFVYNFSLASQETVDLINQSEHVHVR